MGDKSVLGRMEAVKLKVTGAITKKKKTGKFMKEFFKEVKVVQGCIGEVFLSFFSHSPVLRFKSFSST